MPASSGPAYDEGIHVGEILRWETGLSNNKNTPYVSFTVLPQGRVNPKDPDGDLLPCNQYERTAWLYITKKTIDNVWVHLRDLGYPHKTFDQLEQSAPDGFDFAGKEVRLMVRHDTYEGKTRDKWEFPLPVREKRPLDKGSLAKLNAMFGPGATPAANGVNPKPARAKAQKPAPVEEGWDHQGEAEEAPF